VKRFIIVFIVFMNLQALAQGSITFSDKPFVLQIDRDSSILNKLVLDPLFDKLSKEEQEVMYWINFVRAYPQRFSKEVLLPFLTQFPEAKSNYSRSLISELSSATPVPSLVLSNKLIHVALNHATDLGSKGLEISHSSSSGRSFQQRMNDAGLIQCIAENIYEGKRTALECVIFLLIDHGVKNVGHRRNILDGSMKYLGVAFYPIKSRSLMYFLVQDFSCE